MSTDFMWIMTTTSLVSFLSGISDAPSGDPADGLSGFCYPKRNKGISFFVTLSVHEAVNNVPCGVCFSDSLGRIILCNIKMQELSRMLTGTYLQNYESLRHAIHEDSRQKDVIQLSPTTMCFIFRTVLSGCFRNIH